MSLPDLTVLDHCHPGGFPVGYPPDLRVFHSPVDQVHEALTRLLSCARTSLVVAMYGFDDPDLADILQTKLAAEHIYVQLTLDSSQAGGVHEREILAREDYPASSIAVGRSEKGAIQHLKSVVIDGEIVVGGSTNWSAAGETRQDNELIVIRSPLVAAQVRARIDAIHAHMLTAHRQAAA